MPPKAKYTREQIIDKAFEIARERGLEATVARELGNQLGTSSSPIFTAFKNMEELQNEVRKRAMKEFESYISDALNHTPAFKYVGMRMIEFAMREPYLFRMVYMKEHDGSQTFEMLVNELGDAVGVCVDIMQRDYALTKEAAELLFRQTWVHTFGICALAAFRVCQLTEEEISTMLSLEFQGMLKFIKSGEFVEIRENKRAEKTYCVRENEKLRESFNRLTRKTFGFDFKKWYERGHWQDKYIPYVKVVDGEVVSNVSVNIMDFLVHGKVKHFLQIGTVMTDAEHRGNGYNKELMEKILTEYKDKVDGIYLFGNDSVLNYYPKFGFRPAMEYEYSKKLRKDVPGYTMEKINMQNKEEAERFFDAIRAGAVNDGLHMCDNLGLYQFWLADSESIYYLPETDSYVVAEEESGKLMITQVFGMKKLDMDRVAAALAQEKKSNAEEFVLGFTPADKTGYCITEHKEEDCTLFLMGEELEKLIKEKVMFPILSHA